MSAASSQNESKGGLTFAQALEEEMPSRRQSSRDAADMEYFGKKQRLKRNFGLISITGLTCTMMITWEVTLLASGPQLTNGGPTGLFVGYIIAWTGSFAQALVMAEIASMIPLSGGQYNWVAILAPPSVSKFLSYIVGWLTILFWQASNAGALYVVSNVIQYLAAINHADTYTNPTRWQSTLIAYAALLASLIVNVLLVKLLPKLEAVALLLHIAGFFVVLIVMVYLSPHNSADDVFNQWINGGGWSSNGLSFMIGLVSSASAFIGSDSAAHLAEEVTEASAVVPKAMIITMIINGLTAIGMAVAFVFCMGSATAAIKNTGFVFIDVFQIATGSPGGATGLAVIPLLIILIGALGILATSSRTLWAFAREGGMPGSKWLSRVEERYALPLWSIGLCIVIQMILAVINVGSSTAFNAFLGVSVESSYSVFFISAAVMLHKRLTTPPSEIRWGYFRLGRLGVPITLIAMGYSLIAFFFSFWPPAPMPNSENFNWGAIVYIAVVLLATAFWFLHAHKKYQGPIVETAHTSGTITYQEKAR